MNTRDRIAQLFHDWLMQDGKPLNGDDLTFADAVLAVVTEGPTVTLEGLMNMTDGPEELVIVPDEPGRWALGKRYALLELEA